MGLGRETETIEFKETTAELRKALMDVSAILNKHGKGILYFGVKDWGDICGMQIGNDTLRKISDEIRAHIKPLCLFSVQVLNDGEKDFVEVSFSGNDQPYSAYGRYYIRYGDQSPLMERDQLSSYLVGLKDDYSSWENEDSGAGIEDVDESFLRSYVERANSTNRMNLSFSDKEKVLRQLHLLSEKGNLNNAGNVLFSSKGPITLKLAVFATETRVSFSDMRLFHGNCFECINEAVNYVRDKLNTSVILEGNIRRITKHEIPMAAVREIVVNAFAHGMYAASTDFEVAIFRNRVTVYSPGHFPRSRKPEEFAKGDLASIPFNPRIGDILFADGTIEKYGTGFGRTFAALSEDGIDYEYEDIGTGFRFTFFRKGYGSGIVLTSSESQVYEVLKGNPDSTAKSISDTTGLSLRTVQRTLQSLKERDLIIRVGSDKTGYWKVQRIPE